MSAVAEKEVRPLGTVTTASTRKSDPLATPNVPYIGLEHIDRDLGTINSHGTAADVKSTKTVFQTGDLLYGKLRPYLNKVWVAQFDGMCSTDILVYPKTEGVENTFLKYRFMTSDFVRYANENSNGVNLPRVNAKILAHFPIWLPQLSEQRRIVAEIEKQFTRLEAGVSALLRVQANLKRYRAAILKAACEGQLVLTEAVLARKERRRYETASELIARTPAPPRPNRWNSRSKDVVLGHSALAIGNPETKLPVGWSWSALVEIAKMESGHTPSRNHPEWWDGDVAWIGIADARNYDGRSIHETLQHTNAAGIANSASRLLPEGTVCISRTASVGYVVVMGREMATSQDFVNWIPTPAVTSDWLRTVFSADREALRRFGKGSVHKTIYFPEWLSCHIALPPLAEQIRIAAEVDRRLSVVEELEEVVAANLQRSARLRQSILHNAFNGALVPRDPNEEVAPVVLTATAPLTSRTEERIRASRAKEQKLMSSEPIESLDELLERLDGLGGEAEPERLLLAAGLGDDVEKFFDLLRAGRDDGSLAVPTGESGIVQRKRDAN